ncbi:helix-turn-helix domain-containing protein [Kitasatospora sp. NPDC001664]
MRRPPLPSTPATSPVDPAAVGRRIAERQHLLGLTDGALCRRAGVAPAYLRLVLTTDAGFDPESLQRISAALGLSPRELLEGPDRPPPGQGRAPAHPALVRLTLRQCWALIGAGGIGRVALPGAAGPAVLPVNYAVDTGSVVYRTSPHGGAAPVPGTALSFQVDQIDDLDGTGWSVLLTGTAEPVEDPAEVALLSAGPGVEPWAGGSRDLWIRIRPGTVTGRRIGTVDADGHLD